MFTKEEEQFLKDNFKAGEYVALTVLVKVNDYAKLLDALKAANLNLAVLPKLRRHGSSTP